ncbi:hypothetical protein AMECASPLE_006822 [Ameca splendens]|uniref:Uncharacterized protein n=1 Tax=Ameca splendens TaxID=208324 RepID=A0ABV0XNH6_9TELE
MKLRPISSKDAKQVIQNMGLKEEALPTAKKQTNNKTKTNKTSVFRLGRRFLLHFRSNLLMKKDSIVQCLSDNPVSNPCKEISCAGKTGKVQFECDSDVPSEII